MSLPSSSKEQMRPLWPIGVLLVILVIGGAFRLYNVNWDEGTYHIHPDERHTAMVITAIQWPSTWREYFDTSHSPLNPRNVDKVFFYGTVPLFLTKMVATVIGRTGYDEIHLVGRVLSALFDLGSVLVLFFLARRLFNWKVGLVSSFLLAFTALNIQGSHYFTVDTFLTFFVLVTLWFTLDVAEGKGTAAFLGLGIGMGLTLACKVSVFLLVVVVALGAWLRVQKKVAGGVPSTQAMARVVAGLAFAVVVSLAVFRVAQPYAWAGPNYDGWDSVPEPWNERLRVFERVPEPLRAVVMPNPRWIADIVEAGAQQTGEADLPWGRQWTERTPWLYPLENMVLWGMGVPLGVASWLGVGLLVVQLVQVLLRRRRMPDLGDRDRVLADRLSLIVLPLAWVVMTFFWQGMQYVKSIRYFMPIYPYLCMFAAYLVVWVWQWAQTRSMVLRAGAGLGGAFVLLGTFAWAMAFVQIYTEPVTRVQATRWMYENIEEGSAIANEHFDDPLPFSMDGRIAFGSGPYRGLDLTLYDEDTPEKLEKLLDVLDEADYISMSSGRLWQSIPRLPMRYPMTTRYYELLFAEEMGFEKAAEFHSYPRLFGIEFDDTWAEEQFTVYDHPKVLIYRKTGDYDRERVRALLSAGINWDTIPHWLNPRDVPQWRRDHARQQLAQGEQNDLMLTPTQRIIQQRGGTWGLLFDRNSVFNRWPTLTWLLLLAVLGLASLPLTLGVFHWLPDRGYILSRPVGVLLLAWLSWILVSVTPLDYSRGTILLALGIIALVSYGSLLSALQRERLRDLWRSRLRQVSLNELLFLSFFFLFWLIRWGNPDLWHAWKGGEKPMDFAYLNAVLKSTEFPPYDPWFSGGYLNYYYFGQVMVGTLIKLTAIVPSVAYNLVIPAWFAMTAMGAFTVTYNLVAALASDETRKSKARPALFGLVGALFVAVLGNLGQFHLILLKLGEGVIEGFQSTIPGLESVARAVIGMVEVVFGGRALPVGLDEWYWNASRAIPGGPYEAVITEFPFFTFLYADLHAHLIAMPLSLISLAAALSVVLGSRCKPGSTAWVQRILELGGLLGLWSLTIGAMRTTNTWDVPPHLLLALGALSIAAFSTDHGKRAWLWILARIAVPFALVVVLSWSVLYRPFWLDYGAFYNSVAVWTGTRTPLWAYAIVHGLFLFLILSYLMARTVGGGQGGTRDPILRRLGMRVRFWSRWRRLRQVEEMVGVKGGPVGLLWGLVGASLILFFFFAIPGLVAFTRPSPEALEAGAHAYRGLGVLAFGLPVGLVGLLLLVRPGISPGERLWVFFVLLGLSMTLGVEVIVIQGDIGRMNTVFKFYLQVWLLWGIAAAVALARMLPRVAHWSLGQRFWVGCLTLLLFLAALYPPLATSAKIRDRFDADLGPGLDGWAYMKTATYWDPNGAEYELKWDLEAIQWLLDNVVGSPVILEGHTPEYRWGARYSINTGLPAVLGWNWHQRQQRAAANDQEVWVRANDIGTIYNSPTVDAALRLLFKYDVRYIIVGPLERSYYQEDGLGKFDVMAADGLLEVVFRNREVTIYEMVN